MFAVLDSRFLIFGVSILVFVELALDGSERCFYEYRRFVSILVFVELALDVYYYAMQFSYTSEVSILVFVELALDVASSQSSRVLSSVSILVFVELALDAFH